MWRHFPWLAGLTLAPLLFGSVNPDGQAVVGLLVGVSLLLLASRSTPVTPASGTLKFLWILPVFLAITVVPWPPAVIQWLSPETGNLATIFPTSGATFLPLTLSPAASWQRIWELGILFAAAMASRLAARETGFPKWLIRFLAAAVLFEVLADVWYRMDGQRSILGYWTISWGKGAGTFANRNHFANWIVVACMVLMGPVIRELHPLRGARPDRTPPSPLGRFDQFLVLVAVVAGIVAAIASASRGGAIALFAGLLAWGLFLAARTRSRRRWIMLVLGFIFLVTLAWPVADSLVHRLSVMQEELDTRHSKLDIWRDSLGIIQRFPLFGVGVGGFSTAFSHYKTFAGDATFLHAENDLIQWLVECGLVGGLLALAAGCLFGRRVMRAAWDRRIMLSEPELFLGLAAGLVAFVAHMQLEFVLQIPANGILAAVLVGGMIGLRDRESMPSVLPVPGRSRWILHVVFACSVIVTAVVVGLAQWNWMQLRGKKMGGDADSARNFISRSINLWPWDSRRQMVSIRLSERAVANASIPERPPLIEDVRKKLLSALDRDPYNWELRMERGAFEAMYGDSAADSFRYAVEAVRINPLQPAIPIHFARLFAVRDPDASMEMLRMTPLKSPSAVRSVLDLAWRLRRDPSVMWEFTPDTEAGLDALGSFAIERRLYPLAARAYERLAGHGRLTSLEMARRFLEAKRPDLAESVFSGGLRTISECLLLATAQLQQDKPIQVLRTLDMAIQFHPGRNRILNPETPPAAGASMSADALKFAEAALLLPPDTRDVIRLRTLVRQFPDELRLQWITIQTFTERHEFSEAAQMAIELMKRLDQRP